ncbi:non-specific phospholipase C5-like [Rutidosis leptorrhynchoides]|uniref:non-specific phospholipase C5-like n=1 Tax=Rutidosis leptorrhynchoides TaxID=125765 RepID=UPI003A9A372E
MSGQEYANGRVFKAFQISGLERRSGDQSNFLILSEIRRYGNDDQPSHDVSEGQKFVKEVYEALRSSPQWNEILFVVVYDENGGFYDHVPTPVLNVPNPYGISGPTPYNFEFNRLVLLEPLEHSSIPTTVNKLFNQKELFTERDEWAVSLSKPKKMRPDEANEEADITYFQAELVQLSTVLKGDHQESSYPDKLVENMKVKEAV